MAEHIHYREKSREERVGVKRNTSSWGLWRDSTHLSRSRKIKIRRGGLYFTEEKGKTNWNQLKKNKRNERNERKKGRIRCQIKLSNFSPFLIPKTQRAHLV